MVFTYILRDLSHIRVVINSVVHESGGEYGSKFLVNVAVKSESEVAVAGCSSDRSKKITSFRLALCLWSHESGAAAKLEMHQRRRLVRGSLLVQTAKPDFLFSAFQGLPVQQNTAACVFFFVCFDFDFVRATKVGFFGRKSATFGGLRVAFFLKNLSSPISNINISQVSEVADCDSSTCTCSCVSSVRSSHQLGRFLDSSD